MSDKRSKLATLTRRLEACERSNQFQIDRTQALAIPLSTGPQDAVELLNAHMGYNVVMLPLGATAEAVADIITAHFALIAPDIALHIMTNIMEQRVEGIAALERRVGANVEMA